jgi:putative phage-type endonuclease
MSTLPDFKNLATLQGNYVNGSPEWLAARFDGLGGSDIAIVAGLSKWQTPTDLWAVKTGRSPGVETTAAMEWGNRLEPLVIDKLEESHPELTVWRDVGTWRSNARPWQLANPDALATAADGSPVLIEIKTAKWPSYWKEGVPLNYQAQVQWYLNVFGIERAIVAVLFHGSDYQEYEILADPFWQEALVDQGLEFLTYVYNDTPPDVDDLRG